MIKSFLSLAFLRPANAILVPGMYCGIVSAGEHVTQMRGEWTNLLGVLEVLKQRVVVLREMSASRSRRRNRDSPPLDLSRSPSAFRLRRKAPGLTQVTPLLTLAAVYEKPSTWPDFRPKRPCRLGPTLLGSPAARVWHWAHRVCGYVSALPSGSSIEFEIEIEGWCKDKKRHTLKREAPFPASPMIGQSLVTVFCERQRQRRWARRTLRELVTSHYV